MKKLITLLTLVGVVFLLASCTGKLKAKDGESTPGSNPKVLVAYFSATGTTAKEARKVAEATGGTLIEIVPEQPYSDVDLDYENDNSRTSTEHSSLKTPEAR